MVVDLCSTCGAKIPDNGGGPGKRPTCRLVSSRWGKEEGLTKLLFDYGGVDVFDGRICLVCYKEVKHMSELEKILQRRKRAFTEKCQQYRQRVRLTSLPLIIIPPPPKPVPVKPGQLRKVTRAKKQKASAKSTKQKLRANGAGKSTGIQNEKTGLVATIVMPAPPTKAKPRQILPKPIPFDIQHQSAVTPSKNIKSSHQQLSKSNQRDPEILCRINARLNQNMELMQNLNQDIKPFQVPPAPKLQPVIHFHKSKPLSWILPKPDGKADTEPQPGPSKKIKQLQANSKSQRTVSHEYVITSEHSYTKPSSCGGVGEGDTPPLVTKKCKKRKREEGGRKKVKEEEKKRTKLSIE